MQLTVTSKCRLKTHIYMCTSINHFGILSCLVRNVNVNQWLSAGKRKYTIQLKVVQSMWSISLPSSACYSLSVHVLHPHRQEPVKCVLVDIFDFIGEPVVSISFIGHVCVHIQGIFFVFCFSMYFHGNRNNSEGREQHRLAEKGREQTVRNRVREQKRCK